MKYCCSPCQNQGAATATLVLEQGGLPGLASAVFCSEASKASSGLKLTGRYALRRFSRPTEFVRTIQESRGNQCLHV
ncbi:hypothetical protein SERLADRAFT_377421, partial [Serpula lacrymans var. lacrymans S7.9]